MISHVIYRLPIWALLTVLRYGNALISHEIVLSITDSLIRRRDKLSEKDFRKLLFYANYKEEKTKTRLGAIGVLSSCFYESKVVQKMLVEIIKNGDSDNDILGYAFEGLAYASDLNHTSEKNLIDRDNLTLIHDYALKYLSIDNFEPKVSIYFFLFMQNNKEISRQAQSRLEEEPCDIQDYVAGFRAL